ncbi:hypothetical protein D3C84_1207400 [compost metagenome]
MNQRVSRVVQVGDSGELLLQHYCTFTLCYVGNPSFPQLQHLDEAEVVHCTWQLLDVLHIESCKCLHKHFGLKRPP